MHLWVVPHRLFCCLLLFWDLCTPAADNQLPDCHLLVTEQPVEIPSLYSLEIKIYPSRWQCSPLQSGVYQRQHPELGVTTNPIRHQWKCDQHNHTGWFVTNAGWIMGCQPTTVCDQTGCGDSTHYRFPLVCELSNCSTASMSCFIRLQSCNSANGTKQKLMEV